MATARRQEKMKSLLRKLISEFLLRVDFEKKIISVTEVQISENLRFAKIFLSVYPENGALKILESVKSKTGEIKKYLASKIKIKFMPEVEFIIDAGEKNRQRIEELLKKQITENFTA